MVNLCIIFPNKITKFIIQSSFHTCFHWWPVKYNQHKLIKILNEAGNAKYGNFEFEGVESKHYSRDAFNIVRQIDSIQA